ncbi:MAG: exodeoxyribonuclease V subunit alpha [Deltaproteobacteria bacterium]|nr:exodeoxyribonuclease V subunit alpha [Deltaproteobacteria bacterium]
MEKSVDLSAAEKIALLESLVSPGPFHYIDIYFARLVVRLAGEELCWPLFLAALLVSYVLNRRRQICLALRTLPDDFLTWLAADNDFALAEAPAARLSRLQWPAEWEAFLVAHKAVAAPHNASLKRQLLVLDDGRLYLQRYWDYEQRLACMISERLGVVVDLPENLPALRLVAPRFAGPGSGEEVANGVEASSDFQAAAVCAGLRNRFTIISGGPGCGKTSVVAAVAALWLELHADARIMLCAPTGLAQARLRQALLDEVGLLACSDRVRDELLNLSASTIHRLLGYRPGQGFRYHAENQLAVDLLIVDEASMVPLWIMSSLFAALPQACAVILLGDKNQLASVEAGAVLGDLCASGAENRFSSAFSAALQRLTGSSLAANLTVSAKELLTDHIIELKRSYRFAADGGIARLQRAIMASSGQRAAALAEICRTDGGGEVVIRSLPAQPADQKGFLLAELARQEVELDGRTFALKSYCEIDNLAQAFAFFESFRLLSPLRRGVLGVNNLNRLLPLALGLRERSPYYRGRPLMITRNAAQLNLYNGDIGLVWPDVEGRMMVWFKAADGTFTPFSPARLPSHESAFAVTVHKAQGSGFQRVVLLWPNLESALLTREMLYTAVTRAAKKIEIWLPETAAQVSSVAPLLAACRQKIERSSGLLQTLQRMNREASSFLP